MSNKSSLQLLLLSQQQRKRLTRVCVGERGVMPGSPILFAGDGAAIASEKTHTHTH